MAVFFVAEDAQFHPVGVGQRRGIQLARLAGRLDCHPGAARVVRGQSLLQVCGRGFARQHVQMQR